MDHSLLHSHRDGSHIRESPSIPPCTCRSGLHRRLVCRCSSRWRGHRVSHLPSGRAWSPWGDSHMVCRSRGRREVGGDLCKSPACISRTVALRCCVNNHRRLHFAGQTLAMPSSQSGSSERVRYTYTSDIHAAPQSIRRRAATVCRCREERSARSDHLQYCVCTHTSHGPVPILPHGWSGL